ncbi:MAG: hypothetical protein ACPLZG_12685, partial [Thermoproteota archaeon]
MLSKEELYKKQLEDSLEKLNEGIEKVIGRGERVSLLELFPAMKEFLKDKSFSFWMPCNNPMLLVNSLTDTTIVPLFLCSSKSDFCSLYGLGEETITFEQFKKLIEEGRIFPYLT